MKLKERLRIAWQVLTKGTISTLNPHSSTHFFERKRKIKHFTYTYYSIDHPDKEFFLPNRELLYMPEYYEKAGPDGYITSESYLTEKRMEGGEV